MPTFIRAAAQTLRSGTVLRGLTDDEGKFWFISLDLSQEIEGMDESGGDSLISHRVRSSLPGGDLFPETVFMSVTTIPHLATTILDMPLAPDQDEKEWLSELLGESVDELFVALAGDVGAVEGGDEESAAQVEFVDDAPPLLAVHFLGTARGGGLIPGRALALDADADVWLPVDSRTETPRGTDPWAVIRSVIADTDRCETIIGPGSKHAALRVGEEDEVVLMLTPHVITKALSTPEAVEALSKTVDLSSWRWILSDALPRALEEIAALRSAMMKPSPAMGDELFSMTAAAERCGITAPALAASLEMRGSITRTGSAVRPWKVTGDTDLLTVAPATGHALWCPALSSEQALEPLRSRLRMSGLLA